MLFVISIVIIDRETVPTADSGKPYKYVYAIITRGLRFVTERIHRCVITWAVPYPSVPEISCSAARARFHVRERQERVRGGGREGLTAESSRESFFALCRWSEIEIRTRA